MARSTRYATLVDALCMRLGAWRMAHRPAATLERDAQGRTWYRIENGAANGSGPAEVFIYSEIGMWGVSADMFLDDLRALGSRDLTLRINSPGGEVFDGVAIYNALQRHGGRIEARVDGLAASAASFIAMAADEIVMEPGTQMMIHDAQGMCFGDAAAARQLADMLDRTSDTIAAIYAERTGGEATAWREVMRGEQWYDGAGAVAAKLADRVGERRAREAAPDAAPVEDKVTAPSWPAMTSGRERRVPSSRLALLRTRTKGAPAWAREYKRDGEGKFAETIGTDGFMSVDRYFDNYTPHNEFATAEGVTVIVMDNGEYQFAYDDPGRPRERAVFADMERAQMASFGVKVRAARESGAGEVFTVGDHDDPLFEIHSEGDGTIVIYPTATGDDGVDTEMYLELDDTESADLAQAIDDILESGDELADSEIEDAWTGPLFLRYEHEVKRDLAAVFTVAFAGPSTGTPVSSSTDDHGTSLAFWEAQ